MSKFLVDEPDLHEHLLLIHRIAWKLHILHGYDADDLFCEGCLQYLLKREKYTDSIGIKITTFLWNVIWNELLNYIKFQTKIPSGNSTDILKNMSEYPIEIHSTKRMNHFYRDKFQHTAY